MSTALALQKTDVEVLLAQCDERNVQIPSIERRLLMSMGKRAIKDTPTEALIQDCRAIINAVMRDLGISRAPDAYDGTRFVDILREYFSEFTIVDVKQSFELFILGELDEFLPRDSKGKTLDHYQQFSAKFYIALLRAYRQRQLCAKRNITGKLGFLLLQEEQSKRDPFQDRYALIEIIRSALLKMSEGYNPTLVVTASAEYILKRVKVLPKMVSPEKADFFKAKQVLTKYKDGAVSSVIARMIEENNPSADLQAAAYNHAVRRIMKAEAVNLGADELNRRFDWLRSAYEEKQAQVPTE